MSGKLASAGDNLNSESQIQIVECGFGLESPAVWVEYNEWSQHDATEHGAMPRTTAGYREAAYGNTMRRLAGVFDEAASTVASEPTASPSLRVHEAVLA